jgi:hypothetical protein
LRDLFRACWAAAAARCWREKKRQLVPRSRR